MIDAGEAAKLVIAGAAGVTVTVTAFDADTPAEFVTMRV